MNRETKIGMLVGLGVIVLIGVLLSEYLGNGVAGGQQPADLSRYMGEQYRNNVRNDVGAPNALPARPAEPAAGRAPESELPVGFAQAPGPVMGQPAQVQAVGPIPREPRADAPPAMSLMDGTPLDPAAASMETYVILKNDTVTAIAKKFYNAAGAAEIARLVAANPAMLKDATTKLVAGKKLMVPILAVGAGLPVNRAAPAAPVAPAAGTYTVVKGDTISSIAKKFLGTGGPVAVSEVLKANGLKDGAIIREGMTLKIPAKAH